MEIPTETIRTVEDVVREHVQAVVAANPNVPQYVLAVGLGWSPSTLCRRLHAWAKEAGEAVAAMPKACPGCLKDSDADRPEGPVLWGWCKKHGKAETLVGDRR